MATRMLNNMRNFYLECFLVSKVMYNIKRLVLQELRDVVVGVWLCRIIGDYLQEMMGLVLGGLRPFSVFRAAITTD